MNEPRMTMMRLLFSAAHAAADDRALRRALRLWRETGIVPVAHIVADTYTTAELPIAVSAVLTPGKEPVS
jgi:hypothetical protein